MSRSPFPIFAAIDDKAPANINAEDDLLVVEDDLSVTPAVRRTVARVPLIGTALSSAYSLTILDKSRLAIGEPDGTVSLWTAPDATSPLIRKVFTTEFVGKAWHQVEPLKEADGREGLVGLLVDPATPNQCQVIHWSPEAIEAALNGTAPVLNNAPLARVMPTPGSGGGSSSVGVRIWDAEAHASRFVLQYQRAGETAWNAATVPAVNGGPAGTAGTLSTQPGGVTHTARWNALADLGASFNGTVLLRTQATDSQSLVGPWSDPMPYAVNTAADRDSDGDGALDSTEAAFGTNPNAASSRPVLALGRNANGSLTFHWSTAAGRTYRLEATADLAVGPWVSVQGGLAVGTVTIAPPVAAGPRRFYRVVAE